MAYRGSISSIKFRATGNAPRTLADGGSSSANRVTDSTSMNLSDDVIRLVVGGSDSSSSIVTINVHANVLTKTADWFKNAMKPAWATQREDANVIELPDEVPEVVHAWVHWLYSAQIPLPDDDDEKTADLVYLRLAHLYVFGEARLDSKFKNAVIEEFVRAAKVYECSPSVEVMHIVYEGTSENSGARRLLVDLSACYADANDEEWLDQMTTYTGDMWKDVMVAVVRLPPAGVLPWKSGPYLDKMS